MLDDHQKDLPMITLTLTLRYSCCSMSINNIMIILVINKINKMLRYSCCRRRQGKEGCKRKWACCR